MTGLHLAYTILIGLSTGCVGTCSIFLSARRASEAQKYVSNVIWLVVIWLTGWFCTFWASGTELLLFGTKVQLCAVLTLHLTLFVIFQQVYNIRAPRVPMLMLCAWYMLMLMLIIFISDDAGLPAGQWFCRRYAVLPGAFGKPRLYCAWGWAGVACFATEGILFLLILGLFVQAQVTAVRLRYRVSKAFLLVVAIPLPLITLSCLLMPSRILPPVVPVLCAVFAVVATVMVRRQHFSNIYDLAYREVLNSLGHPLFIVDNRFYVRHVNTAAKVLYPEHAALAADGYGRRKAAPDLQDILDPPLHKVSESGHLHIGNQVFEPEVRRIVRRRMLYGYVVILYDVTDERQYASTLEDLNKKLSANIRGNMEHSRAVREKFISGVLQFAVDRDATTADHMRQVSNYTYIIVRQMRTMGIYAEVLTSAYLETLTQVAPLHDVGKVFLPPEVLHKASRTSEEEALVRTHVEQGLRLIDRMIINDPNDLFYTLARQVVEFHHEHWDGTGYPKGLSAEDIPLSARIVAVADAFEKRSGGDFEEAFSTVVSGSETRFDSSVITAFVAARKRLQEAYSQYTPPSSIMPSAAT